MLINSIIILFSIIGLLIIGVLCIITVFNYVLCLSMKHTYNDILNNKKDKTDNSNIKRDGTQLIFDNKN